MVKFVALGVDYEMYFSALTVGGCSGGEGFGAGDGEEVDVAGELPALGGGDGVAKAVRQQVEQKASGAARVGQGV